MNKSLRLQKAVCAIDFVANCEVKFVALGDGGKVEKEAGFKEFTLTNREDFLRAFPASTVGSDDVFDVLFDIDGELSKFVRENEGFPSVLRVVVSSDELELCPNVLTCEIDTCDVRSFDSLCGLFAYLVERFNALYAAMKDYPKYSQK